MSGDAVTMQVQLECSPSYTLAYCYLALGETVYVESGAMVMMSEGLEVAGGVGPGGISSAAVRKIFGGQNFMMGRYSATHQGAWVAAAPPYPGDIASIDLQQETFHVQQGSLLAVSENIDFDVKYAGVRSIVLREGATMLRLSGTGQILVSSFGGLQRFDLGGEDRLTVDTGHLVGLSDTVGLRVEPLSGVKTSVLTGEGLVARLSGPGTVFVQTRAEQELRSWLAPHRAQRTN